MLKRNKLIIANWKMYLGYQESIDVARELVAHEFENVRIVLCPSFIALAAVEGVMRTSSIGLGAQDAFFEDSGAYTGEISPAQLREIGVSYVIVGHSERRQYQGETDEVINKKLRTVLEEDMIPIVCVGETFEQRQEKQKDSVLIRQLHRAFEGIEVGTSSQVIIAYEPVWVIGSGQAVDPEEAEHTNAVLRQVIVDLYPSKIVQNFSFIYGGSVSARSVKSFCSREHIDGVLVGGASIRGDDFMSLIQRAGSP